MNTLTIVTGRKQTEEWLTRTTKQVSRGVRSKEVVVNIHKKQACQKAFTKWRRLKGGWLWFS